MNIEYKELIVKHTTAINHIRIELNNVLSKERINELLDLIAENKVNLIIQSSNSALKAKTGIIFNQLNTAITDINIEYDILIQRLFESLTETPVNSNEFDKYQNLREKLTPYIRITTEDLKKLINGENLQPGTAKWIGKPVEAYRFAYWLNPKESPKHNRFKAFFNNNVEGCKIRGNQAGKDRGGEEKLIIGMHGTIWDILKDFRLTKEIDSKN